MHTNTDTKQQYDKVLIVDDDENWCFIAKKILQKAGFATEISTAKNGLVAFRALQEIVEKGEALPELIFLDIKMPVMDGFEFLEEINRSATLDLNDLKIVVCSSSMHPKDKERANLYPIAGFITKPFTRDTLKELLG